MRPMLRVSLLTALFFTGYSGVVLASSTACRVAVVEQLRSAQAAVHKRVHHSATTLARWKIGAAAWSKAHGGKAYAGMPAPRRQDWTPLQFHCNDVALDLSRPDEGLLLPAASVPEFAMDSNFIFTTVADDLATVSAQEQNRWRQAVSQSYASVSGGGLAGSGGGQEPNVSVGPTSFPPAPTPPLLASPVPTPESPTIVLLGTGMLSFLVSRLRRRTVV